MSKSLINPETNILIVDDEPGILRSLQRLLTDEKADVIATDSPEKALEILEQSKDIALVISDMRMPGMSGVDLLEHVKNISPDTIRIILTGYTDINTAIEAINRGEVHKYISKPWKDEEFLDIVRDSLKKYSFIKKNRNMAEDIKKHAENLEGQLRQAQKMEAIGTLAGGIAHDFNNILTAILGYTQLALCDVFEGGKASFYLKHVFKSSLRAKELVKQILNFSRETEEKKKPLQISLILKESLFLLRASLPAYINIRQNTGDGLSLVMGDATQIYQVFLNLCINAAQAMEDTGGTLTVELNNVDMEIVNPYNLSPGPYLRLSVSDTGKGINPEIMEKIFEPYFTTKKDRKGTGLGLSIVRKIVRDHGGEITVKSEINKGSVFYVFFPRIDKSDIFKNSLTEKVPGGKERILFVDDEEEIVALVRDGLEKFGYEIISCTDAKEAFEIFQKSPEKFDMVITDYTMPCMKGVELAKKILSVRAHIPVILCSGFEEVINNKELETAGICKFIVKPYTVVTLSIDIRNILDEFKDE